MIARVSSAFPALRHPVFRRYLLGGTLLTIGGFMLQTAQGWLVLVLTNSPALLGLAGAAATLPTLFLAPVAGVLADRVDRRRLLILTNTAGAIIGLTLAILTTTGIVEYWHVVALALLGGLVFTVQLPAAQAVVSSIVPREAIGNAVAPNSAQYNFLRIVAPAVAGLFIAANALELGFWVNAFALAVAAYITSTLVIPSTRDVDRAQAAIWHDLRDGIRYVLANRLLTVVVLLPAVPALFVLNYLTFIPLYARDILGTGAAGIGFLTGAIGIGALAGALTLATARPAGGSGRLIVGAMAIVGCALTTFAVSRSLPISMLALGLIGTFQVMFYSTTNTLIQVLVPARLRGRVLSLYTFTSIGLIPVANLAGGALAETIGVETVLAAGGVLTVSIAIATAVFQRQLLRLRASHVSMSGDRGGEPGGEPGRADPSDTG